MAHDGGPPITAATRFDVASVSKLLTAAEVVRLANQGRLGLDDPLSTHLPGVVLLVGDAPAPVTLRQLLVHRAGLPHQPVSLDPIALGSRWDAPDLLGVLTARWSIPLARAPGTYGYSNLGYVLLAAIVERAHGRSFAEAMSTPLVALGMPTATFWPLPLEHDVAHGRVTRDGASVFQPPAWYGSRYALPFTGLWTSTPELARFGAALIEAAHDPTAPLHAMTPLDAPAGHGLGPVHRPRRGLRSLEHDGSGPGFMAWLIAIPEHDLVVALACNGGDESRASGERFRAIADTIVDAVW